MSRARDMYPKTYELAGQIDDLSFDVLEYVMDQSEENDSLVLTDEFIANDDRPYVPRSELASALSINDYELNTALQELTGRTEESGYLETNDYRRETGLHETRHSARREAYTDWETRKIVEKNQRIEEASPDELSVRLGDDVQELEDLITLYSEQPESVAVYDFVRQHQDDCPGPLPRGMGGVPLRDIRERFDEPPLLALTGSMPDQHTNALKSWTVSADTLYEKETGRKVQKGIIADMAGKAGFDPNPELEEYEDHGIRKRYHTAEDPIKDRITGWFLEKHL